MGPPATIPLSYVMPVLQALERMGHDRGRVFEGAGVANALVAEDEAMMPVVEFTRLYRFAFRLLEAETSQRTDRSHLGKDAIDMMYYCVINCGDLGEAIERVIVYNRLIGPLGASLKLIPCGDAVRLEIDLRRSSSDTAALLVDLVTMNVFHQLFSWLIGEPVRLRSASVKHAAPADFIPMTGLFGVPLRYGQPVGELTFPASYLKLPVVRSYAELLRIIDYVPFDIWYSGQSGGQLSDRVRALLMVWLQRQLRLPGTEAVAQLFHISAATLRRRLQEENSSYAKIRAACLREYAEYLLTFTRCTMQEIAERLGFGDDRAFRRAFHGWHGCGPAQFRAANAGG